METLQNDVLKFMRAGQEGDIASPFTPSLPAYATVKLAYDLLVEECDETMYSLESLLAANGETLSDVNKIIASIADGYIDTIYVCLWGLTAFGIDAESVWNEVQKTNMAKINSETGKVDRLPNGKIVKPEGWKPPDILRVLRVQAMLSENVQRKQSIKFAEFVDQTLQPELTERQHEMMKSIETAEPDLEGLREGLKQSFSLHDRDIDIDDGA